MKLLNEIPSRNFCAIDVETVRIEENFENLSEEFQSAWENKNKQNGIVPDREELADLWTRTASLYAEFSKVCAVSLAFLDATEEKLMVKEFYGEDEVQILQNLNLMLERIYRKGRYRLVGHASKYFDFPFLCKRYVINGEDIPNILDASTLKPWEQKNLDTNMDIWKMGGTGPGSSLQALCTALSIPISKVDLVGDEVGRTYFKGEFERIGRYCSYDTIATFNIIRFIKKEPIFNFEEVVYIEDIKEPSVLERLYTENNFTEEIKKEIKKLVDKKKVTEKDKKNLIEILRGVLVRTDFENMDLDNKTTVESKEIEIENFIETL